MTERKASHPLGQRGLSVDAGVSRAIAQDVGELVAIGGETGLDDDAAHRQGRDEVAFATVLLPFAHSVHEGCELREEVLPAQLPTCGDRRFGEAGGTLEHVLAHPEMLASGSLCLDQAGCSEGEDPADVLGLGEVDRAALRPRPHDVSRVDGRPHRSHRRLPQTQGHGHQRPGQGLGLDTCEAADHLGGIIRRRADQVEGEQPGRGDLCDLHIFSVAPAHKHGLRSDNEALFAAC